MAYHTPLDLIEGLQRNEPEALKQFAQEFEHRIELTIGRFVGSPSVQRHLTRNSLKWLRLRLTLPGHVLNAIRDDDWESFRKRGLVLVAMNWLSSRFTPLRDMANSIEHLEDSIPRSHSWRFQILEKPLGGAGGDWIGGANDDNGCSWIIAADIMGNGLPVYPDASWFPVLWSIKAVQQARASGVIDKVMHALDRAIFDVFDGSLLVGATVARLAPNGHFNVGFASGTEICFGNDSSFEFVRKPGGYLGIGGLAGSDLEFGEFQDTIKIQHELLIWSDGVDEMECGDGKQLRASFQQMLQTPGKALGLWESVCRRIAGSPPLFYRAKRIVEKTASAVQPEHDVSLIGIQFLGPRT